MKNSSGFALSFCAALLAFATVAHADTVINGTVWENQNPYSPGVALAAPTGPAAATFTVSAINFSANTLNYTIGGFLGSNLTSSVSSSVLNAGLNNTIFDFTGTTYLQNGQTYSLTHDDGIDLFINGSYTELDQYMGSNAGSAQNIHNLTTQAGEVITAGLPTSAALSSFTWTGATGSYSYDLLYTEVHGQPGVLNSVNFPASTPEPGSLALLTTSLLGGAGILRRRRSN